jgi:antitoxin MazE
MRVELVRIGNSRGIRIPKPIIEQCGLGSTVRLRVDHDRLIVSPDRAPRQGWEEAFQAAGTAAKDRLVLDSMPPNRFDVEEWEW